MIRKTVSIAIAFLLLGSLAVNVLLWRRVTAAPAAPATASPARASLAAGTRVPDLDGRSDRGDLVHVRLNGSERPTLLYVVSPRCVWCHRNEDNFLTLLRERGSEYNVVLVSLTSAGLAAYVADLRTKWKDAQVQVVTEVSERTRAALMLDSTPQTIVVGPDGRVVKSWRGAYTQQTLVAVENFFLVEMPGLRMEN
jgi:hypothetical protein